MYLPSELTHEKRREVCRAFEKYVNLCLTLFEEEEAVPHWAKLEILNSSSFAEISRQERVLKQLRERYDLKGFAKVKKELDPNGILSNEIVDVILGSVEQ